MPDAPAPMTMTSATGLSANTPAFSPTKNVRPTAIFIFKGIASIVFQTEKENPTLSTVELN